MELNWYAIHTLTGKEDEAKRALSQQGIDVFAPMAKEKRPNGGKYRLVDRPFFPRYIFANFDALEQAWKVKHSRGVSGIVCCGDRPSVVPDFLMEELFSRIGNDGYMMQANRPKPTLGYTKGETLVIEQGVWTGHEGIFQGESGERVNLLLSFLGGERVIAFDYSQVSSKVIYTPIY
jgi:transcriptional antiterminator RfaH